MNASFRSRLKAALQIAIGTVALGALVGGFLLFLKLEQRSLYRNAPAPDSSYRSGIQTKPFHPEKGSDSLAELFPPPPTSSERALAGLFSADTLPRLLRAGLIKQLRQNESGSLLIVHGGKWRKQSGTRKHEILEQLRAYNKVNAYPTSTQVRDMITRQLLAEISPSSAIAVFL